MKYGLSVWEINRKVKMVKNFQSAAGILMKSFEKCFRVTKKNFPITVLKSNEIIFYFIKLMRFEVLKVTLLLLRCKTIFIVLNYLG